MEDRSRSYRLIWIRWECEANRLAFTYFENLADLGNTTSSTRKCVSTAPGHGEPATDSEVPLPDTEELKKRVIENEKKSAQQKERYLCITKEEMQELDAQGVVKEQHSKESETFLVNGREISHLLVKDGKPLSGSDEKREQDRVTKEVKKYTDLKKVKEIEDKEQKQLEMFLKALRYSNGHREFRENRSVVVFDLSGDPKFHPSSIEEKFAKALIGRIWIDEESGELAEMHVNTAQDIKIAGGLVASLHKGFTLHLQQARQSDGVWLTSLVEGNGDARAGLFFHPRFRFRQTIGSCRLYTVDATSGTVKPSGASNQQ